ncbi:MAG: hypothetical protein IJQ28_03175 [Clostridia bacterium]|nr:hypothetical protein [Clostridia bacterium]
MNILQFKKQMFIPIVTANKQTSRLPNSYSEVEYIEIGDSNSYISLSGRKFDSQTSSLILDIEVPSPLPNNTYLFFGNQNPSFVCQYGYRCVYGGVLNSSAYPSFYSTGRQQITISGKTWVNTNGKSLDWSDRENFIDFISTNDFMIGYTSYSTLIKIYPCKFNGDDIVPCYRKSDNAIGLYDTGLNTFSAGTGTFTKGNNI